MNIVNCHVHMIELETMLKTNPGLEISSDLAVFKNLDDTLSLMRPESLFAQMDEAGIARAVLFACEAPYLYASNEYIAKLCSLAPKRLIGFASVNPLKPGAPAIVEKAVRRFGLRGLKFHPPLQNFYPDDEKIFPVYEKAAELDIPVVFHVGTTPFGSGVRLDQANPLLIDAVACAFPKLRIMLTHLGTLWHNEAFMVVEKNPNVFIDTAAYLYEIKELLTPKLVGRIGEDKIIFGTDYPMPFGGAKHRMKDFVDCVEGLGLSPAIKEKIFNANFERLLNGFERRTVSASEIMGKLRG